MKPVNALLLAIGAGAMGCLSTLATSGRRARRVREETYAEAMHRHNLHVRQRRELRQREGRRDG